jgi:pilus assembly protein CpaB
VTRTVLQNISVLSAGQTIQTDGKSQSIITPVVTLLVEPHEAEALTLANNEGHIQLVLRNSTDEKKAATPGRQLHDLYGPVAPAPAPAGAAAASQEAKSAGTLAPRAREPKPAAAAKQAIAETVPAPAPDQMILILGTQKKVEVFGK